VVVAEADRPGVLNYFYFARVPEETYGWGANPEKIVGPLTAAQFDVAEKSLGLPAADIKLAAR
jgi:hypothetical protein